MKVQKEMNVTIFMAATVGVTEREREYHSSPELY